MTERVIARCPTCGTQYTARGWPWLEALGNELRACAMPGCGEAIARTSDVARALSGADAQPANDNARKVARQ